MERTPNLLYRKVNLLEIAEVEKAVKNKIYSAGTIYIRVSACKSANQEQFQQLKTGSTISSDFAVVLPKIPVIPEYFKLVLERSIAPFMHRYVGTNINIQVKNFKYFQLEFHDDLETQKIIANLLSSIEKEIDSEESNIQATKNLKSFLVGNMFC